LGDHGTRLSVCMIVRDESESLPSSIGSVKKIADEVIVVDTGSTDDSVEVAKSLGARVVSHVWRDDFADARNVSIREARGDWILCLDADETVPQESEDKILAAISGDADAYFVRIESRVDSSAGRTFVNFFPRLFRNIDGVGFEGRVHEQVHQSFERIHADVRVSDIALNHSGYALSETERRGKAGRNADLLRKEVETRPGDALAWFHLGEAYSMMDDYDRAASCYKTALKAGTLPPVVGGVVLQNLGGAQIKLKRYSDAAAILKRALEADPNLLTVHLVLASALFGMKKFDKAEREILTYITRSQGIRKTRGMRLCHEPDTPIALVLLARCRLAKGDTENAKKALSDALGIDDSARDAHLLLGRIAFEELSFGQAAAHYEKALGSDPGRENVYFELARAYVACGSTDKAITTLEEAIEAGIGGIDLIKCLGVLRIKKRDFDGAIEVYRQVLAREPHDQEAAARLAGLYHTIGKDDLARQYLNIH
jgi:tetratricopeptide (TPR) repeat protein